MARRRTIIKIPFLKFRINKNTIFNILGFLLIGTAFILLISYLKNFIGGSDAKILSKINKVITGLFGGLAIFLPFCLLLLSGHFFNTKKFKIIKINISAGLILVFLALLGIFQSGNTGVIIFRFLSLNFSLLGGIVILSTLFFVGLILLLDTSIDVFLLFIMNLVKSIFNFGKTYIYNQKNEKKFDQEEKKHTQEQDFIKEETIVPKKPLHPILRVDNKLISIKPLNPATKTAWVYPPLSLLADVSQKEADRGDVNANADNIEKTLESFGIRDRK